MSAVTTMTLPSAAAAVTVTKPLVPPPLSTAVLANRTVPMPLGTTVESVQQQQQQQATDTNGHDHSTVTETKKKRKRSESDKKESKSKRQKTDQGDAQEKKKKKKSKKNQVREEEEEDEEDEDDQLETDRAMTRAEFAQYVESIMTITGAKDPEGSLVMLEQKVDILDTIKTWFGIELHEDDAKLLALLKEVQLSAIYKGMALGKLVVPMDDFQKDGAIGFINHLLESEAAGKHLVPYAFCCWDSEREVSGGALDNEIRTAAMNPSPKNFWRLNKKDEMKKALRRTKFWYCFAQEMEKALKAGDIDEEHLTWDALKAYCEAFWYENEEAKKLRKYYVTVYVKGAYNDSSKSGTNNFQAFPAWPIPKGAYKEERDFLLGVWPFVQVYFMSPKEGPVVLMGDKKSTTKINGSEKPSFDFKAAMEKRGAKHGGRVDTNDVMVIDDDDGDDEEELSDHERKQKKKKQKSVKKSKGRLTKFTDSQAEEASDDDDE